MPYFAVVTFTKSCIGLFTFNSTQDSNRDIDIKDIEEYVENINMIAPFIFYFFSPCFSDIKGQEVFKCALRNYSAHARPRSSTFANSEKFLKISTRVHLGVLNNIYILSKIALFSVQKIPLTGPVIGLTINLISLCFAELYYWKFPHLLFKTENQDKIEVENDDLPGSIPMETIASPVMQT